VSITTFTRAGKKLGSKKKEAAKEQEQHEWKFYTDFLKASREGYVLNPEDGSENHRMAEKLVAKGMLEKLPPGMGYDVPGQQFLISTEYTGN
jgi:hypothetical protein